MHETNTYANEMHMMALYEMHDTQAMTRQQQRILEDTWHIGLGVLQIPTCGRQGSTSTNTKLTYNLFTPGPSVRLVENLAEDQLPLLLLLQVPEVVLVHHPVGPLLVEVLVGVEHQNLFCCPSAGR